MYCIWVCEEVDFSRLWLISKIKTQVGRDDKHSDTGLVFPGTSKAPPMHTILPICSLTAPPPSRTAKARFVRGPRAMYVTVL